MKRNNVLTQPESILANRALKLRRISPLFIISVALLIFSPGFSHAIEKLLVKDVGGTPSFKVEDDGVVTAKFGGLTIPAIFDSPVAYRFAVEEYYSGMQGIAAGSQVWNKFYLFGDRARGTIASPAVPLMGDGVFEFLGRIYDGNNMKATAGLQFTVDGVVSDEVAPQRIDFLTGNAASRISRMTIKSDGKIGIGVSNPTHLFELSGGAYSDGNDWYPGSSRDLKENIVKVDTAEALETLSELHPVAFNYKNDPDEIHIGFIAEDVPELVAMNERKNLSAMDIVAVLTKVMQEQQKSIAELQERLAELEIALKFKQDRDQVLSMLDQ